MDFSRRSDEPEWMDTQIVGDADFAACLADLAVVNTLTLAKQPTLAWLNAAAGHFPRDSEISVLDVGFGHGDMLRAIRRWGDRRGLKMALHGIDLNPLSKSAAERATGPEMQIDFQTGDVFALRSGRQYDVIICSLVTHHLTDAQVVNFINWMERQARRGWFINDLHRHWLPYHAFRAMAALARWHRFVRHDGPVSIARSFRREDWRRLLAEAGIKADIRWHMPFRLCVGRLKSGVAAGLAVAGP